MPEVPIVTRDQVEHAKPAPDLFLAAAQRLGVNITASVVVEDSVWDLLAAQRARALGIGLLSGGYGQDELERAGAHWVYQDPADLLDRLRLFVSACCRRVWPLLTDERSRIAVEHAELFADRKTQADELKAARAAAHAAHELAATNELFTPAAHTAAAAYYAISNASIYYYAATNRVISASRLKQTEQKELANLLRDIFGPLTFRTLTVEPSWLSWNDGTMARLAKTIYEDRRFEDMPILADALMDAGCHNEEILNHCRRPREHVRGCWALDLILGKE